MPIGIDEIRYYEVVVNLVFKELSRNSDYFSQSFKFFFKNCCTNFHEKLYRRNSGCSLFACMLRYFFRTLANLILEQSKKNNEYWNLPAIP